MNEIVAQSWDHLHQILYDIPKTPQNRHRSDLVYRGLANTGWELQTSLRRLGPHYADVEKPLLRSFGKYAEPGAIPDDTFWVRIAVAQHHGLPTRLLDWTLSPRVAMHFATTEAQYYDSDGVIWTLDVVQARDLLPEELRQILDREKAFLFSVEMLNDVTSTLERFDALGNKSGSFVLFFEPPSLDARIVNQGAIMSVMPGVSMQLGDFLKQHPDLWRRIVIPKTVKWEVRDKLDQDNVTERIIQPGLDGLSLWLKRYYGPGPKSS